MASINRAARLEAVARDIIAQCRRDLERGEAAVRAGVITIENHAQARALRIDTIASQEELLRAMGKEP